MNEMPYDSSNHQNNQKEHNQKLKINAYQTPLLKNSFITSFSIGNMNNNQEYPNKNSLNKIANNANINKIDIKLIDNDNDKTLTDDNDSENENSDYLKKNNIKEKTFETRILEINNLENEQLNLNNNYSITKNNNKIFIDYKNKTNQETIIPKITCVDNTKNFENQFCDDLKNDLKNKNNINENKNKSIQQIQGKIETSHNLEIKKNNLLYEKNIEKYNFNNIDFFHINNNVKIKKEFQNENEEYNNNIDPFNLLHNNGRWLPGEQQKFIEAIFFYGNDWKKVQEHIISRSSTQARSHAQKYFIKLKKKYDAEKNTKNDSNLNDWIKKYVENQYEEKFFRDSNIFENQEYVLKKDTFCSFLFHSMKNSSKKNKNKLFNESNSKSSSNKDSGVEEKNDINNNSKKINEIIVPITNEQVLPQDLIKITGSILSQGEDEIFDNKKNFINKNINKEFLKNSDNKYYNNKSFNNLKNIENQKEKIYKNLNLNETNFINKKNNFLANDNYNSQGSFKIINNNFQTHLNKFQENSENHLNNSSNYFSYNESMKFFLII